MNISISYDIFYNISYLINLDTNQNERNSEKGHDGELAVHLRKTGNYDAAPIFPNIDKMHRVVSKQI